MESFMKRFLCTAALVLLTVCTSCRKTDPPDVVASRYFQSVAAGDFLALQEFLTPDGQYMMEEFSRIPQLKEEFEKQREAQRALWSGLTHSVKLQNMDQERALVLFTASYNGKSASVPLLFFMINGKWCLSMQSFSGPGVTAFKQELDKLKATATETVSPATVEQ